MNRTRKLSRKATVVVAILLALVITVSATWAWFQSRDSVINPIQNTGFVQTDSVVTVERFDPPDEWNYGVTVDKEVAVLNAGTGPVVVRVGFEEFLNALNPTGSNNDIITYAVSQPANTIPAKVNKAIYDTGWTVVPHSAIALGTGVAAIPANVTVVRRDGTDLFRAYATNAAFSGDNAQAAKLGNIVVKKDAAGADVSITMMTDTLLGWHYFTPATAANYKSWTGTNLSTNARNAVTGLNENWTTLYTASGTVAAPAFTYADPSVKSIMDSDITINLGDVTASATADKWFFNPADGYFYYYGVLDSGATTVNLLESLTLAGGAKNIFEKFDYALAITTEALQATPEAITAVWGAGAATLLNPLF